MGTLFINWCYDSEAAPGAYILKAETTVRTSSSICVDDSFGRSASTVSCMLWVRVPLRAVPFDLAVILLDQCPCRDWKVSICTALTCYPL